MDPVRGLLGWFVFLCVLSLLPLRDRNFDHLDLYARIARRQLLRRRLLLIPCPNFFSEVAIGTSAVSGYWKDRDERLSRGRNYRLIARMLLEKAYFVGSACQVTGQPASLGPMIELMRPDGGEFDGCQLDRQFLKSPIADACRV